MSYKTRLQLISWTHPETEQVFLISFRFDGSYYPQTHESPAEYPELEINYIADKDHMAIEDVDAELQAEIEEYINTNYR